MPLVYPRDGGRLPFFPTRTFQAREENSSAAIALHGEKALTPIIAGTISGMCVGAAWLVALIVILVKRYKRKRYYKQVGKPEHQPQPRPPGEEYIVPPDPAVLEGKHQPGDRVVVLRKKRWWRRLMRSEKKKVATASDACNAKGKEREPVMKMTQELYGCEGADVDGKFVIHAEDERPEKAENQQTTSARRSNSNETPHHPYFNRLDTILSLPEAPEDRQTQTLQGTTDDGTVKKTDFAIGGGDEEPASSGSYPEPRHDRTSSHS